MQGMHSASQHRFLHDAIASFCLELLLLETPLTRCMA